MKDQYPDYPTVPRQHLVAPELQPDYLDLPGYPLGDSANVATEIARGGKAGPSAVALIHHEGGRSWTFDEIGRESARLANVFAAKGVRPGDRVAFRSTNRPEAVITAMAAWRLGAIVVPTPPQSRAGELRFLLQDTGARLLVTLDRPGFIEEVESAIEGTDVTEVIAFGEGAPGSRHERWVDLLAKASADFAPRTISSDGLALIWHTGGTTGVPKACYHTQRRFLLAGYSFGGATGAAPGQRWAASAPLGHALGFIYHTIFTILNGATVVMIEDYAKPEVVLRAIAEHKVHTFTAIAQTWARMLEVMAADPSLDNVGSLKRGYAMWQSASSAAVRDGWMARGHDLLNNFGSTAFATWITVPRPPEEFPAASLGRAAPGYVVEAVDPESKGPITPLGRDVTGKMAVKGPSGLTYWNRHDSQEKDVRDGWSMSDDLIRIDTRGYIDYLGRTDFLISTAGNKVAPVEVEEVLARHPAVREVGVIGTPDPIRQEIVTAFIAVNPGVARSDALKRELQDLVKTQLSPNKYPRRVEFIEALPRDTVGKVQPRMLKDLAAKLDAAKK